MRAARLPAWLRRGVEAGLFAGLLSLLTVIAYRWDRGAAVGITALPAGLNGSLAMALPVLAIGVFAVAYPVGLSPTRLDAILGAATGAIVAADLLALITAAAGERVMIRGGANVLPVGFLAGILATPAAVGGIAASQLFTTHGFGRRAGRVAAVAAVIVATLILLVGVPLLG
jgi:hypothetical protein